MPEEHETPISRIKLHIHSIPKIEAKKITSSKIRNYNSEHRREPVQWSEEEVELLKRGVAELGPGRWKDILDRYRDKFHTSRTSSDMFNKYRLMTGRGSYNSSSKINFVEVGDDGEVICNALGEYCVYSERFPHAAAVRAGKLRISKDVEEAIVNVQGKKNGVLTRHRYRVFEKDSKVVARKLLSVVVEDEEIDKKPYHSSTHE